MCPRPNLTLLPFHMARETAALPFVEETALLPQSLPITPVHCCITHAAMAEVYCREQLQRTPKGSQERQERAKPLAFP